MLLIDNLLGWLAAWRRLRGGTWRRGNRTHRVRLEHSMSMSADWLEKHRGKQ